MSVLFTDARVCACLVVGAFGGVLFIIILLLLNKQRRKKAFSERYSSVALLSRATDYRTVAVIAKRARILRIHFLGMHEITPFI